MSGYGSTASFEIIYTKTPRPAFDIGRRFLLSILHTDEDIFHN